MDELIISYLLSHIFIILNKVNTPTIATPQWPLWTDVL